MALLITLFLVLINIFNNITTNSPKAEGLTAIEIWMLACILFVFGERFVNNIGCRRIHIIICFFNKVLVKSVSVPLLPYYDSLLTSVVRLQDYLSFGQFPGIRNPVPEKSTSLTSLLPKVEVQNFYFSSMF